MLATPLCGQAWPVHPDHLVDGDLTLRRAVPSDAADIVAVYSEADTRHWMLWEGDEPPDDAEALANIERSEKAWAEGWGGVFRVVVDGHVVGGAMLRFADPGTGEAAYFLRQSARGRGLATRSLLMVADWGFREHGLMRVYARVDPENIDSVSVVERAGFTREGLERQSARYPGGRWFDSLVYSLLPAERVTIRPATADDAEFLTDTAIAATQDQGRFPADLDLAEYRAGFLDWTREQLGPGIPGSTTSVVTAYGADVGRLRVVRTPDLVELAGLQLLPAHQGKGIGTRLVRDLMAEAASSGRRFGLSVEKDNPRARALYERLGLTVLGEDGDEWVMRLP
jgi:RimJ/RimL family protein N-acetyltransferase